MLEIYITWIIDVLTTFMFVCIVNGFVLPLILERLIYYIPHLVKFAGNGEVKKKSIVWTILEVLGWILIVGVIHVYFYLAQPSFFHSAVASVPALLGWITSGVIIFYKFTNLDRMVRKNFYYYTYSKYMTDKALEDYMSFSESVKEMSMSQLIQLREKKLPYLYQQSVVQRIIEKEEGL